MHRSILAVGLVLTSGLFPSTTCGSGNHPKRSVVATRQNVFSIPFTVQANSEQSGGEVALYVSGDLGKQWTLYQRQPADAGRFHFRAGRDGEYWFSVRTKAKSDEPAITQGLEPELKVVVDTVQPRLDFSAEPLGTGGIQLKWQFADDNLDPNSFRIFHKDERQIQWQPTALRDVVPEQRAGTATWTPPAGGLQHHLRAEVYDRAGNASVITRVVHVPPGPSDRVATHGGVNEGGVSSAAASLPNSEVSSVSGQMGTPPLGNRSSYQKDLPLKLPTVPWPAEKSSHTPTVLSQEGWRAPGDTFPRTDSARQAARRASNDPAGTQSLSARRESSSAFRGASRRAEPELAGQAPPGRWTNLELPEGEIPRTSRSSRFQLDYDLRQTSPEIVQRIELWMTENGGRTWRHYGDDPDRQSPFDVTVQREGTYGFRLIIRADSGLPSRPPQSGELADVWVLADWTRPEARLLGAEYGQHEHAGRMIIRWQARDSHLSTQAVSLSYSSRSTGPWESIAAGLPNSGQYVWRVSDHVPRNFYLRLQVRDQAGNEAVEISSQPINLDGLSPQARIRGVRPVPAPPENKSASALNRRQ